MSKHTPGPWVLGKVGDTGYSEQVAPCHIWTSKGPGYGMIATTSPYGRPTEQNRIDARLITAAPDLLEALRCFLDDPRFQVGVGGNPIVVERMIDQARAAIAKATGE